MKSATVNLLQKKSVLSDPVFTAFQKKKHSDIYVTRMFQGICVLHAWTGQLIKLLEQTDDGETINHYVSDCLCRWHKKLPDMLEFNERRPTGCQVQRESTIISMLATPTTPARAVVVELLHIWTPAVVCSARNNATIPSIFQISKGT